MTEDFLQSLLYEEESDVLDFKRDQYKFINCSDFEKAELLKDILAFCNAWRRTDAFILIGVEEIKGGESKVVGMTDALDDGQIQQFVNGKTQRPVNFSYKNLPFKGKRIAVIQIPVQERPIYLKKDYGSLKANVVYLRRGSSTTEATPDEIVKMRDINVSFPAENVPRLFLAFRNSENDHEQLFKVPAYRIQNKDYVLSKLNNLRIADKDLQLIEKHKSVLDGIEDRYPDGNAFYPYKVDDVKKFNEKIAQAIEMAETDFEKLCSYIDLFSRSLEFGESFYTKFRTEEVPYSPYTLLNISNKGKSPSKGTVLYITASERVKFLALDRLRGFSITVYDQIPKDIAAVIQKAKELERGLNIPIVTMYERVTGRRDWHYLSTFNIDRPFLSDIKMPVFKLVDDKIRIVLAEDLMHNHETVVPGQGIYLCPFLKGGEEDEISYVFHARNLPDPQEGKLTLLGVEYG